VQLSATNTHPTRALATGIDHIARLRWKLLKKCRTFQGQQQLMPFLFNRRSGFPMAFKVRNNAPRPPVLPYVVNTAEYSTLLQENQAVLQQLDMPIPPVSAIDRDRFSANQNWISLCNGEIKKVKSK
jgi:hypothetical protein